MSISQLFILSRRGDSIIYRDFRQDIKKSNDIFFHNVNFVKEEEIAPPLFNIDCIITLIKILRKLSKEYDN